MIGKQISGWLWARRTKPERALMLVILAYVLIGFGLGKRCFDVFGHDSGDMAAFDHMMWHSSHGRLFHCSVMLYDEHTKPVSMLALHSSYFWVFLMPVYALFPGMTTLLFLQSLALGLAAIPMYLIVRWAFQNEWAAVFFSTAFLLLPPVISQHVNQVEEPSFLPVFLLYVFLFFLQRRFGAFLLMALVSCLNRENAPLAVAMFGVWALFEKRDWKWVVAPIALGALYFGLVTFWAIPYFREGQPWKVSQQFGHLGAGPAEIVTNFFRKPELALNQIFNFDTGQYLTLLLQPMGWLLPLTHFAAMVALPDLAANILSSNNALRVIPWHYNLITSSSLFVALVLSLRKVDAMLQNRGKQKVGVALIGGGAVALALAHWPLWFQPQFYQKLPYHDTLVRALAAVPPDKSVMTPVRLTGHVARRESFSALGIVERRPKYAALFEYVVLDANDRRYLPVVTPELFGKFYKNPSYQLVFAENNVFVFRRVGDAPDWSYFPPE